MIRIDTNLLISFATNRDSVQLNKALALFESGQSIYLEEIVLTEADFVLRKVYKQSKSQVHRLFELLFNQKNIFVSEFSRKAIKLYIEKNIELTDALLLSRGSKDSLIATFDKKLIKLLGKSSYF